MNGTKILYNIGIVFLIILVCFFYRIIYNRYLMRVINKEEVKIKLPEFRYFTIMMAGIGLFALILVTICTGTVKKPISEYPFIQIVPGSNHYVGLTDKNQVYTWGHNTFGQLGNGTTKNQLDPINITKRFNLTKGEVIQTIIVKDHSNYALSSENRIFAWGHNFSGQLNDGTNVNQKQPIDITERFNLSINESIIDLNPDSLVTSNGNVYVWWNNRFTADSLGHFDLDQNEKIIKIQSTERLSLALTSKGRLFRNFDYTDAIYEFGEQINQPKPIDITNQFKLNSNEIITDIISGDFHNMVMTSQGRLFSWGLNIYGQLGDGTTVDRIHPIDMTAYLPIDENESIVMLEAGRGHNIAITSRGRVLGWGYNAVNQLLTTDRIVTLPMELKIGLNDQESVVRISVVNDFNIAITTKGRIITWGYNWLGSDQL